MNDDQFIRITVSLNIWTCSFFVLFLCVVLGSVSDWWERLRPMSLHTVQQSVSCEKGEQWQWALLLLNDLLDKRLAGNRITYTSTISACEKGGRWQWALYFHGRAAFYDDQMQFHCPLCSQVVNSIHFRARILGGFWARSGPWPPIHLKWVTKMPCWLNHFREQVRLWSEHVSLNTNGRRRNTAMMSWHITIGSDSIANSLRGLLLAVSSKMRKNPVPILTFFLKGVYLSKSIKSLLGSLRKL